MRKKALSQNEALASLRKHLEYMRTAADYVTAFTRSLTGKTEDELHEVVESIRGKSTYFRRQIEKVLERLYEYHRLDNRNPESSLMKAATRYFRENVNSTTQRTG